jgi:cell division protein FtsQ
MIKYKSHIKTLLFLLLLVGLFGFAQYRNSIRKVTDVKIEFEQGDNLFITSEMVNKLLTQSSKKVLNQSKESIILKDLEQDVLKNEMIEDADVFLTVDGVLKAKIIQRKPLARIQINNESYYLDRQGKKMPLSKIHSARVPIVTGVRSDKDLKHVFDFCTTVLRDDFMKKLIIGMHINAENEFELKTRLGNQIIVFGDLKEKKRKINKLKAFYQNALRDKSLGKYKKINLIYSNQVVCTKI